MTKDVLTWKPLWPHLENSTTRRQFELLGRQTTPGLSDVELGLVSNF